MNYNISTQRMPYHSNMTNMNHLGALLNARPEKLENVVTELFATKMYSDNSLTNMLMMSKRTKEIGTTAWEYELIGGVRRPAVVLGSSYASDATPGKGSGFVILDFDTDEFLPGDVISPGGTNKQYQSRVSAPPTKLGKRFRYRLKIMNDSIQAFIPVNYCVAGALWGKLYSQYEEGSDQSGSTTYSTPIALTGRMSRYRKMYSITGDAANEVLGVQLRLKDEKGSIVKTNMWLKYAEVVYWQQWYRELERGLWYTRTTKRVLGSTGNPINTGAGLQQQLESSHRHFYNTLSAKLLQEFIMDVRYSRVAPGRGDVIEAFTGEYGMVAFHNAVMQDAKKNPAFTLLVDNFVNKTSSPYTSNALSYGAQFTEWLMPNGVKLRLRHNPIYDDPEINFEIDQLTGKPIESMRYTFLDVAGDGQDSNIIMVNKKGGFKNWYVAGGQSPYGPVVNGLGSHSGDYYEMHVLKQCGIHLSDPTRCGELILQRA